MVAAFIALCGLVGNALFAYACITMGWKTWRAGHNDGVPAQTMWTFFVATIAFGVYLFATFGFHWAFTCMAVETLGWAVVIRYHYWPRGCVHCKDVYATMAGKLQDAAKVKWDKDGPCAPQCLAECEGYCANVSKRREVGKVPELAMGYQGRKPQQYHNTGDWSGNP